MADTEESHLVVVSGDAILSETASLTDSDDLPPLEVSELAGVECEFWPLVSPEALGPRQGITSGAWVYQCCQHVFF